MQSLTEEVKSFFYNLKGGEKEDYYFYALSNKDVLSYKTGEECKLKIKLLMRGESVSLPSVRVRLDYDGGKFIEYETPFSEEGIEVKFTFEKPEFVRVRVFPLDENGEILTHLSPFEGGASADFNQIEIQTDEPKDFDEYWKNIEEDIEKFDIKILEKQKVEYSVYPEFDVYKIKITCPYSLISTGYLSVPKGEGKYPATVMYSGYGIGDTYIKCFEGFITLTVNPHGLELNREQNYYDNLAEGELKEYGFNNDENEDKDRVYFKKILVRAITMAKFVQSVDKWNKVDLTAYGGSQGAMQSIAVAAHCKGVSYCYGAVPWLCDLQAVDKGKMGGWRPDYRKGLAYYDTALNAKRVKCPIYLQAGLGDYVCPPSGIAAMYNGITAPKYLEFMQNSTHAYRPPYIQNYVVKTSDEIAVKREGESEDEFYKKYKRSLDAYAMQITEIDGAFSVTDHKKVNEKFKEIYGEDIFYYRFNLLKN